MIRIRVLTPDPRLCSAPTNYQLISVPGTEVEKVLKGGTEQIHHEDVVVPLLAVPPNVGDAHTTLSNKENVTKSYIIFKTTRNKFSEEQ